MLFCFYRTYNMQMCVVDRSHFPSVKIKQSILAWLSIPNRLFAAKTTYHTESQRMVAAQKSLKASCQ